MTLRTRIEPIDRDIELMLSEELSPKAQSKLFAEFAGEQIEDATQANKSILGRTPHRTVTVDGREGAALQSVRPDGVIIAEWELVTDVLAWIGEQLVLHSPVKSGRYQKSHTVFADGQEIEIGGTVPAASQYIFLNTQPYSRKIETGSSSQAPDGVYQAVATLAKRRFGNIAKVEFNYRTLTSATGGSGAGTSRRTQGGSKRAMSGGIASDKRTPAIVVTLGGR